MKVKVIEIRSNEFVEHLKKVLNGIFNSLSMSFDINYFVGENAEGKRGLCFILSSSKTGIIYEKLSLMKSFETPADVEEKFICQVIDELVVAGVGFMSIEKLKDTLFLLRGNEMIVKYVIHLN